MHLSYKHFVNQVDRRVSVHPIVKHGPNYSEILAFLQKVQYDCAGGNSELSGMPTRGKNEVVVQVVQNFPQHDYPP